MAAPASETEALNRIVAAVESGTFLHLAAATGAVANQFVTSTSMKNGAYTVANSGAMPAAGARHVTVTHSAVSTADTLGVVTVTGTDLDGDTISEAITPTSGGTATGTKWFATVTSVVGSGWTAVAGADSITVGCAAGVIAVESSGTLQAVVINATAAATITLSDETGTIAILAASLAEGRYPYGVQFSGYLAVSQAGASDATYIYTAP